MNKIRPCAIASGIALLLALSLAACTVAPVGVQQDMTTGQETTRTLAATTPAESSVVVETHTPSTTIAETTANLSPTTTPSPTPEPTAPTTTEVNVDSLHDQALVIDTHNDTVLKIVDDNSWLPEINLAQSTSFAVDLPKLQAGGIDIATFAAYTKGYMSDGQQNFARANSRLLALINAVLWLVRQNPASTLIVLEPSDLSLASSDGQIGIIASIEGAYSFADDNALELLRQYRDLGIRMLAPVWNNANALGVGTMEVYRDGTRASGGLTATGRAVIQEMNRIGLVVDVSHMNDETFWDTLKLTTSPVIASHSSAYRLCANARNLKDDQIQAVADNGGVIQAVFYRSFLSLDPDSVTVSTLVDHIDYLVQKAGIDHVGLGSDFDGASMPAGLKKASDYKVITRELKRRGYSDAAIVKILGGNTARLLSAVWQNGQSTTSSNLQISTDLAMGASISDRTPQFIAKAALADGVELDTESLKVIIDGKVFQPTYDPNSGDISYTVASDLSEKFHVVTFMGSATHGTMVRTTRIFYIS